MLTSLYYARSLKWIAPAGILLGTAPTFLSSWWVWRILTVFMPRRVYERGDEAAYALYQRLVLFFYENWTGTQFLLYGDYEEILKKKENVIFISNHQSTVDWVIADMLAERQGSLGNIRYILKDGLKYFPLYGMYFRQHSCIYVKRSGLFKEDQATKQLRQIRNNNTPFWMVVFPEGTRYNPDLPKVVEKSKQFAIKEGEEPFSQHLTPRVKAFQLCVKELRETTDAVYDITAAYSGTRDEGTGQRLVSPGLADYLSGVCRELHIHVDRIPIDDVPTDSEDIKQWLYTRFRRKDQLMERFYSSSPSLQGTLGDKGIKNDLGWRSTLPTFLFWMGLNTPMVVTAQGRELYWKSALFGMALGWGWMAVS